MVNLSTHYSTRPAGMRREKEGKMTNAEGFRILGERAEELSRNKDVQKKMVEIAKSESRDAAQQYLYRLAIATLCGI